MMKVKILNKPDELNMTAPFEICHLLWGTKSIPHTYAYLGFVPGDGFYLRMVCEESNPLRTYTHANDPVFQDSAMEAFLHFDPKDSFSPVYLNFEMNANGALLAGYGQQRTYRSYFNEAEHKEFNCRSYIEANQWTSEIRIPVHILKQIYGHLSFKAGDTFSCNFYKISETAEIEHYASYSPILTSTPTFHVPEYFATAVLE